MKLNFWHGDIPLHNVEITPKEESALPKIAFVGNVCFLMHEITVMADGSLEAQYQAESPMMIPAAHAINQHFFPSSPIKRN